MRRGILLFLEALSLAAIQQNREDGCTGKTMLQRGTRSDRTRLVSGIISG